MHYLLKTIINRHIRSTNPSFPLQQINIENIINTQRTNFPNITPQIALKHLHKLLSYHITDLAQIILPPRIHLMDIKEFEQHHTKPTKALKNAISFVTLLTCHTSCTNQCQNPCNNHPPPRTLLPQFIISPINYPSFQITSLTLLRIQYQLFGKELKISPYIQFSNTKKSKHMTTQT